MRRKCGEAVGSISCCHTRVYGKVPMTKPNVDLLIEWLGHEGAVAGLDKSHLTNADLMIIAREKGLLVDKRTASRPIAIELVMGKDRKSVGEGKSVSVRVDLGGRRSIKKKK